MIERPPTEFTIHPAYTPGYWKNRISGQDSSPFTTRGGAIRSARRELRKLHRYYRKALIMQSRAEGKKRHEFSKYGLIKELDH